MSEEKGRLRRVGVLWKPKPGSQSKGSGSITINGLRQRFVILKNDRKAEGSTHPDYVLMSSDEPEVDQYARPATAPPTAASARPAPQPPPADDFQVSDDDLPF